MVEAMESVSCSEPKRSYSWWWDSHITPKNSKWLQENLADMDSKIESMIELIEEDADSFARRAEMYYKKRPELMKLVEEFYRAYRALAERYDHVTGALRQAHRTIAIAFPNQIQFILPDEPPSALPDTVEEVKDVFTLPSCSNGSREPEGESIPFMCKEEWKQLNCLLAEDEAQKKFAECFLMEGLNLNNNLMNQIISKPEISHMGNSNTSILHMAEEQYIILQEENNSLQHTVDEFKKTVARQEEEVTFKEEETNKRNRQMIDKVANKQSLKKLHSQCEEQIKPLGLGTLSGTEMRRMELSRAELGELKKCNDEDNYLNEKSFSLISKIDGFQDDINSPKRSRLEIADETKIQGDVSYYLKNKSTPEERYHELKKRIDEINFNLVSLRALITDLHDWKNKPIGFNLEDLRLMNSTLVKHCISENSEFDVNAELNLLREKIMGLEYCCESVQRDSPNHESQNTALVSHVEAADQNIKKLWEKNRFFENSLSDIFVEFEGLRGKMKALEESCQLLFHQNYDLIAENSNLKAQLENIKQNMQCLEDRFSNFEGKYTKMEKENDLLRSGKDGQENHVLFFRNGTTDLNNQIQILKEENGHLNEELEDEQHKTVKSGTRALHNGNMHSETKNVLPKEIEINIQVLLNENVRKDDEIDFLRQSNGKLVAESSIWLKNAEAALRSEEILTAKLQRAKDESKHFEDELAACLFDIHVASINGLMYEQKIVELVLKLKNLETFNSAQSGMPIEEGSLRNVQREILMERLHALEHENKELKEELTGYLPLVVSLDNDIASLEELTLSPANHHILSSKKKQVHNVLAPDQTMQFSQVSGEDHIPMVSSGILVLKKMHATVRLLQKEASNTKRLLEQEEAVGDSNTLSKTRENKARRSKGSTAQLETEKKKDIVFDSRKSNAFDEDVRLNRKHYNAKHEHITKDIELDHVSSFRSDFHADSDEQALKMLGAAVNYVKEDHEIEILEGERSNNPSSEFVLEKELSIDTIELPENVSKSHLEWNTRIGEILSSDALRLTTLQKNVEDMKNINVSAQCTMNEQLKSSEAVIIQLTDINFKLTRIAHNFSASSDDLDDSGRWKLSDRVQRASEKIGEVELEIHNTKIRLLRIQEEESKESKALQKKSRISLLGFLYGRRADSKQKKKRLCSCMGFNNKDD